jgi:hypothetical protein
MTTFERSAAGADPYSVLGLAPGASRTEVKRAYRRLAMHFHPDHAESGSLRTFLAVKAAYEWIVAHPAYARSTDRRASSAARATVARPVRRAPPASARPAPWSAAARSSWPGGRWYWEGMRARAARR